MAETRSAKTGPVPRRTLRPSPLARQTRAALRSLGRRLLRAALARLTIGRVRIVDVDGSVLESQAAPGDLGTATVRVHDADFYGAAGFGGSIGIAEAYMDALWETDDLPLLIEIITANVAAMDAIEGPMTWLLQPVTRLAYWLERNTRTGSRRNIVAHYDLGNDFFERFLDPTMTYSCAIFENGATTLEEAQREKIDRACRKLELRPTDHLLEIGTGWGALAIHAASRYGCRVTTTTISDEQYRCAVDRIRAAGLSERVQVVQRDYRDLAGEFDKLVSIEMVEAVGAERLGTYLDVCSRRLRPDGAALLQAIVIRDQFYRHACRERDFLKAYIFPGSCLPSVTALLEALRDNGDLRLWHLEDIGPHYATTLRLWREAFMDQLDAVRASGFDDRFIRMWEFYLAYCEGAFRARHVGDVQLLLTKPRCRIAPSSPRVSGAAPALAVSAPARTGLATSSLASPPEEGRPA